MTLIDLDPAGGAPSVPAGRRPRMLVGVALLAAGALIGNLATHRWEAHRTQTATDAAASAVVLADATSWVGDAAQAATTRDTQVTTVSLTTRTCTPWTPQCRSGRAPARPATFP